MANLDHMKETIAKLLWERFAHEHELEWPPTHAAEFRLAAEDVLNVLKRDRAAELLRAHFASFCDADHFPGVETFADAMEAAGFIRLVAVTREALEEAFAVERGIEPGGMMWELTDAGREALKAPSDIRT